MKKERNRDNRVGRGGKRMKFRFKKSILPIILCLALIITVLPNVNDIVRASGDEGTAAVSGNELNGTEPTDPGNESSVLSLQSSAPAAAPSESSQEPSSSSDESSAAVTGGAKGNDVTSGSDESTQAATEGSSEASTDRSAEDPDGSISGNAVDETCLLYTSPDFPDSLWAVFPGPVRFQVREPEGPPAPGYSLPVRVLQALQALD